jgi:hypothetical protein
MAMRLPYQFDTTGSIKLILGGVLGLLVIVIVPGILYSLFISHRIAAVIQLLLIGAFLAWFGRVVVRNLSASVGTITREAVLVQPARLYGIRFPGPAGRFPVEQFRAVRVERIFGPLGTVQGPRWHERVSLMGTAGGPDILVARTELDAGITLGRDLATQLGLAYEEQVASA